MDIPTEAEPKTRRRVATNVSLSPQLLAEAKAFGINISAACELGLTNAVKAARDVKWRLENQSAIAEWSDYVEEHGLPLAELRQF